MASSSRWQYRSPRPGRSDHLHKFFRTLNYEPFSKASIESRRPGGAILQ